MEVREIHTFTQDILEHAGRQPGRPARRSAACAVLRNPRAGQAAQDDLQEFIDLSVRVGEVLSRRALEGLGDLEARAYGKAVLVGSDGDLEQGAAMIHCRLGLAMRSAIKDGPALIPGNAKLGGPGAIVDVVLGGVRDSWDYDAMDTIQVSIPGAPRPDELVLVVAFATNRPNARVRGATPDTVAEAVARMRSESATAPAQAARGRK